MPANPTKHNIERTGMISVEIKDAALRDAAAKGMDEFLQVFLDALHEAIGGELSGENMVQLSSDQITLLAYEALRNDLMNGGFIQLIHNGWGAFIFHNPFDKAVRAWGIPELCALIRKAHKLYKKHRKDLEQDCTDEEFMALYEQYPQFDDFDDAFVENEEAFTAAVARYVDEHIEHFAQIV